MFSAKFCRIRLPDSSPENNLIAGKERTCEEDGVGEKYVGGFVNLPSHPFNSNPGNSAPTIRVLLCPLNPFE